MRRTADCWTKPVTAAAAPAVEPARHRRFRTWPPRWWRPDGGRTGLLKGVAGGQLAVMRLTPGSELEVDSLAIPWGYRTEADMSISADDRQVTGRHVPQPGSPGDHGSHAGHAAVCCALSAGLPGRPCWSSARIVRPR